MDPYRLMNAMPITEGIYPVGHTPKLEAEIERLREANRLMREAALPALAWIDDIYPPNVFDGSSGDEGAVAIVEIREKLRAALAVADKP